MARTKKSQREQLVETLRARGLRKKVAEQVASAVGRAPKGRAPKTVQKLIGDLNGIVADLEKRVTGGGGKDAKRVAAGKKAAATRKREANKRSASSKKAAQTRAKKSSSTTKRSTAKRSTSSKPRTRAKAKA